jgi:hypothetical protein
VTSVIGDCEPIGSAVADHASTHTWTDELDVEELLNDPLARRRSSEHVEPIGIGSDRQRGEMTDLERLHCPTLPRQYAE